VGSSPSAELWIDGHDTHEHTPYAQPIDCGRHQLLFKRPDLDLARSYSVEVSPGKVVKQSFSLFDSD
jgi:hypothetical protein